MSDLILELGSVIAMNNRPPVIAVFFRKLGSWGYRPRFLPLSIRHGP